MNLLLHLKVMVTNQINSIEYSEEIEEQISEVLVYLDIQTKYENKDQQKNQQKEQLQELLKEVCLQIEQKCTHHYIKDDIDIGPETSMKIEYCVICEKQK